MGARAGRKAICAARQESDDTPGFWRGECQAASVEELIRLGIVDGLDATEQFPQMQKTPPQGARQMPGASVAGSNQQRKPVFIRASVLPLALRAMRHFRVAEESGRRVRA